MAMDDDSPRDPAQLAAQFRALGEPDGEMLAALHEWRQAGRWDTATLGPPPGSPGCKVPPALLAGKVVARKADPRPPPRTAREMMERLRDDIVRGLAA
jgi:hypothetical protein